MATAPLLHKSTDLQSDRIHVPPRTTNDVISCVTDIGGLAGAGALAAWQFSQGNSTSGISLIVLTGLFAAKAVNSGIGFVRHRSQYVTVDTSALGKANESAKKLTEQLAATNKSIQELRAGLSTTKKEAEDNLVTANTSIKDLEAELSTAQKANEEYIKVVARATETFSRGSELIEEKYTPPARSVFDTQFPSREYPHTYARLADLGTELARSEYLHTVLPDMPADDLNTTGASSTGNTPIKAATKALRDATTDANRVTFALEDEDE